MNCHKRMSIIVLLLLWTLCNSGTGVNINAKNVTNTVQHVVGLGNGSQILRETASWSREAGNLLQHTTTTSTLLKPQELPQKRIKSTTRSKLWSPYSTLSNLMEENDDDVSPTSKTKSLQKSDSTLAESESTARGDEVQLAKGIADSDGIVVDRDLDSGRRIPIISSIRHYRSRKSFVRTRKNSENNNLESESEPMTKGSHVEGNVDLDVGVVTDLDEVQGDQPYLHKISTTATTSPTKYASGTRALNYGKVTNTGEKLDNANSKGQNSGISSEGDVERVYGIPYFIPQANRDDDFSTKKLQKIDNKFNFPKKLLTNSSRNISNGRNGSFSGVLLPMTERAENYLRSINIKYGSSVLDTTLNNKLSIRLENASRIPQSKMNDENQDGTFPSTKRPRGGKKGRGEKSGSKTSKKITTEHDDESMDAIQNVSTLLVNSESTISPSISPKTSKVDRKRIGNESQQGAFRKVKERQRGTSRHPGFRDKSDYQTNYNLEVHADDNDNPSQFHGASPQTQEIDPSTTFEGYKVEGDGGSSDESRRPIEYFPKVETQNSWNGKNSSGGSSSSSSSDGYQGVGDESMFEVEISEPSNPDDVSESLDSIGTSSPPESQQPNMDIVTVFLKIVESQHLLGENCSRGTDFHLGEGVVDRYAQERFRLEAELTVNRANMLTRFWKYAEPKTLEDEYLLHAMVISLIEFDEDIFAAGNCYDENQYKNYTLFCPFGYREQDGSILVKDLSLEYPYLSNTSEWFYKARKDAERIIRNYNRFSRDTDESVIVFKAEGDHDHVLKGEYGIPSNIKEVIQRLHTIGIKKPNKIISNLRAEGLELPGKVQLNNYLAQLRKKEGPRIVHLGQIAELCDKNARRPSDLDQTFVIGRNIDFENKTFQFGLSTSRLLSNTCKTKILQADATYKLTWEGFPVLVIGASDKGRRFHPFCIAVCSGETQEDFQSVFQILKDAAEHYGEFNPKVLIADCAQSITNAFKEIFGNDYKRVHCYFHVMKNVKERLKGIKDKELKQEIKEDIAFLQLADTAEEFGAACQLWIRKWKKEVRITEFLNYFVKEYIDQRSGWFEGLAPGAPSTNNGLESTNARIKKEATFRERLSLNSFFSCIDHLLNAWSHDRNPLSPDFKDFLLTPNVSQKLLTESYQWVKEKRHIRYRKIDETSMHCVIPAAGQKLNTANIEKLLHLYQNLSWKKFDSYRKSKSQIWIVIFNNSDWKLSNCNCRVYKKEYICKHVIAIGVIKKLIDIPDRGHRQLDR